MEYRNLDLTLISASGLKEVNKFRKINVYASAKIRGYPKSKKKTKADKNCGINPVWNHQMMFVIDEPSLKPAPPGCGLALVVRLKAEVVGRNKRMGEVYVPIHQLFEDCGNTAGVERLIDYEVKKPSGKVRGTLKVSYVFGEKYRRHDVKPEDLAAMNTETDPNMSTSHSNGMETYPHHPGMDANYPHQRKYSPPPSPSAYPPMYGGGYAPAPILGAGSMMSGAGHTDGSGGVRELH